MDINSLWSNYDLNSKKQNSRCLAVNTILEGKYLVGPVLGQGGFGITYVGYDLNMESKIAIKEYFPVELVSRDTTTMHGDRVLSLSGEKSVTYKVGLEKYVAEAQNVSQFSEVPGVVSVKDFFYANETAYIVMEFIDGISLKDYLKEKGGRLTEEETLKIMKPILEALVQIHKSGIIHRDISPDNIMLTFEKFADGRSDHSRIKSVKLIDFGAARMTEKNDQKSLTIILKHGYAPEEQYRTHGEQGPWTDVYALCAVLYRMLTGETPVPAMDRMFQDELKTFDKYNVKVSANIAAAILKGLAVKKDDRIQSVQELIAALYEGAKVKKFNGVNKKGSSKTGLFAGIGVAVMALCVIGVVVLSGKREGLDVQNMVETIADKTQIALEMDVKNLEAETQGEVLVNADMQETLGEQIAFYHPNNSMAWDVFGDNLLICKPNGMVEFKGNNSHGEGDVQDWENIVSVQSGDFHSLGLRTDGTVFAAGDNDEGQCEVDSWTDVVQISAGYRLSLGVTKDGRVLIAGAPSGIELSEFSEWTDMKDIAISKAAHSVLGIAGLKKDGTVLLLPAADSNWDTTVEIYGWEDVVEIFLKGDELYGIDAEGICRGVNLVPWGEEFDYEGYYADDYRRENGYCPPMKQVVYGFEGVTVDGVYRGDVVEHFPEVAAWTNLISVGTAGTACYGLQEDGTILEEHLHFGNAELNDFKNLEWISCLGEAGIIGRTKDGELLSYGLNVDIHLICEALFQIDKKLVQIEPNGDVYFLFDDGSVRTYYTLDKSGEDRVKQIGYYDGSPLGLSEEGVVVSVLEEEIPESVAGWTDLIQIDAMPDAYYGGIYGLKKDGTVISTEENFKEIRDIKQIAVNDSFCIGLTKEGNVIELSERVTQAYQEDGVYFNWSSFSNVEQIDIGEGHAVGLKADGTVVAEGMNNYGQCNVEDWKDIVYLEADGYCTLGITKDGDLKIACDYLTN